MNLLQPRTTRKAPSGLFAAAALGLLALSNSAQAAVSITIAPSGANVVATGSGSINLAALNLFMAGTVPSAAFVNGDSAALLVGGPTIMDVYTGLGGPTHFGSFVNTAASSGSGDMFGVSILGFTSTLRIPQGYISKDPLSGTATWNGHTISSLGLTPGTYVYNWGTGKDADSLTLQIVPEPSSTALLALGATSLLIRRRRLAGLDRFRSADSKNQSRQPHFRSTGFTDQNRQK